MKGRIWLMFGLFLFVMGLVACQAGPVQAPPEPVTQPVDGLEVEEKPQLTQMLEPTPEAVEASATEAKPEPSPTPKTKPSPRGIHHMAYDSQSRQVILYGGIKPSSGIFLQDTWAFDTTANTWARMDPDPSPGRGMGPMAYDSGSDRVIFFVGAVAGGKAGNWPPKAVGETWAYDYDSNTWANLEPVETPWDLWGTAMVYDIESDQMILFGGCPTESACTRSDTWAYDYDTNIWTQMSPAVSPPRRFFHAMAYDAESDRVILWGGGNASPPPVDLSSVWAYDYNTDAWEELESAAAPEPVRDGAMVYDPDADLVILYAGTELWTFDYNSNTWTQLSESPEPGKRFYHDMVFVVNSGQVFLFGGGPVEDAFLINTWSYDLNSDTWIDLTK